jgi:histone H3/H4
MNMKEDLNPQWERHFQGIADELLHLAISCDVRLRDPGVIERILKNDASVCGRIDERSFRSMHNLLVAYYKSITEAAERIGPTETKKIIDAMSERMQKLRDQGHG